MRKLISVFLALAMVMTMSTTAFAALPDESVVSPQYTYIDVLSANLTIEDTFGISTSTASCYVSNGQTVEIVCKLQQYSNASWATLKTWTAFGSGYASINQDWAVHSGYTYRVYVTFRIINSSGRLVESTTKTKTCVY